MSKSISAKIVSELLKLEQYILSIISKKSVFVNIHQDNRILFKSFELPACRKRNVLLSSRIHPLFQMWGQQALSFCFTG